MTLRDVKVGQTVKVLKITGEGAVKRRIMDMGLTKGIEVYVRKVAPLGDPIEVTVRGYELSLRKADAEMVEVEAGEAEMAAAGSAKAESAKAGSAKAGSAEAK